MLRPVLVNYKGSETSKQKSANAPSGTSSTALIGTFVPESPNNRTIVGLELVITFNVTQSAAASYTASQLFGGLEVIKNSKRRIELLGNTLETAYAQLVRLFNMLTGFSDATSTVGIQNGSSAGAAGASSVTLRALLPLHLQTSDGIPQVNLYVAGYGNVTDATAASATAYVRFMYDVMPNIIDDEIKVVVTPSSLAANTEVNIGEYLTNVKLVKEVFVDAGSADSNVNYSKFKVGSMEIYGQTNYPTLRMITTPYPYMNAVNGFLKLPMLPSSFPAQGSSPLSPQLIVDLATSEQLAIWALVTPE